MGQVTRAVRNAPLASEADQRDVMTGAKAMRAALLLREVQSWEPEILNDEDIVLGARPAGQSNDQPSTPNEADRSFCRLDGEDRRNSRIGCRIARSRTGGRTGRHGGGALPPIHSLHNDVDGQIEKRTHRRFRRSEGGLLEVRHQRSTGR